MHDLQNILRYLIEGLGVALAAYLVSGQKYTVTEIALIGFSAAVTLFLLDMLSPQVASGVRQGTGFGLGLRTVNLPGSSGLEAFADEKDQAGGALAKWNAVNEVPAPANEQAVPGIPAHYNKNCGCNYPCAYKCQAEEDCKVTCPDTEGVPTAPEACHLDSCNISVSGCPYKLIPGYYSHRVLLPGYNECVQPYNSEAYAE